VKNLLSLGVVLAFIVLNSCSNNITVTSDFNTNMDFSTYRSYRWHEGNEFNLASRQYMASDLADQRIRENVDAQLLSKGIRMRENGPVNFLINYSVTTQDRIDVNTYNTYSGYGPGWTYAGYGALGPYRYSGVGVRYNYGVVGTETVVTQYSQGTLVLDIVEPLENKLVWRGIAEGKIKESMSQSERIEMVEEVIRRILDGFPPDPD